MSANPAVSVVVSVYNGARRLEASLQSLLVQADVDFELVVVDDGSNDGTADVLYRIASVDPRVRILHQENQGLTRALIRGCAEARGAYIARQDSGDRSLPGRLALQAAALDANPGLAFVSCGTRYVDDEGDLLYSQLGGPARGKSIGILDFSAPYGVVDGPTHHGSVMFRKDAYLRAGGYRPQFYFGQDWDLWYRLAVQGEFFVLPQVLLEVVLGAGDISLRFRERQQALAQLSLKAAQARANGGSEDRILEQAALVRPGGEAAFADSTARACYFIGECLRRNGRPAKARRYFRQALRSDPLLAKAWLRLAQSFWGSAPAVDPR